MLASARTFESTRHTLARSAFVSLSVWEKQGLGVRPKDTRILILLFFA